MIKQMIELLFKMKLGCQTLKCLPWHHSICLSIILHSHRKHFPKSCSLKYQSYEMLATDVTKKGGGFHGQTSLLLLSIFNGILFSITYSPLPYKGIIHPANHCVMQCFLWERQTSRAPYIAFGLGMWHSLANGMWAFQQKLQDALEVSASFPALISVIRIACSRPCLFFQPSPGIEWAGGSEPWWHKPLVPCMYRTDFCCVVGCWIWGAICYCNKAN